MSRRKQSHPKSIKEKYTSELFEKKNVRDNEQIEDHYSNRLPDHQLIFMGKEEQVFICDACGIEFHNENILNAHRKYYCQRKDSTKRKCSSPPPAKRMCCERDVVSSSDKLMMYLKNPSLNYPVQIGRYIYVPIPVLPSSIGHQPLDLRISKSEIIEQEENVYQCQFCSIQFRLRETLQAHQDNYCLVKQKQKYSSSDRILSYTCRLCDHRENHLEQMHNHLQFHLFQGQSCSEEDILCQSLLFKCLICSAMFDDEDNLLDHIRCIHVNSKLIQCLECRSKFSSKWNLIRHMKILHTNIHTHPEENSSNLMTSLEMPRNYCSVCQITFRQKSSYQAHQLFYCAKRISS